MQCNRFALYITPNVRVGVCAENTLLLTLAIYMQI